MEGYKIALIAVGGVLAALIAVFLWGLWENRALQGTRVCVKSKKLPAAFDGFLIAHISDLHNACFGKGQEKLAALLREAKPDLIAVTGDLIDKRRRGTENALRFAALAVRIAPVYYVAGNHEAKSEEFPAFKTALEGLGVRVLSDAALSLGRVGEEIVLAGLTDVRFFTQEKRAFAGNTAARLQAFLPRGGAFTVLLAHRPELFPVYRAAGADLTLSGHAHGGQFRLPLLGGLIAPEQGLFPKYTSGLYRDGEAQMAVSRGLGNSSVPVRLNNRPEVLFVRLSSL